MATTAAVVPQEDGADAKSTTGVDAAATAASPAVSSPPLPPEQQRPGPPRPEPTTRLMSSSSSYHNTNNNAAAYDAPTMNLPIFIVWILPLLAIALYGRLLADVTPITIPVDPRAKRPHGPPVMKKKSPKHKPPSSSTSPVPSGSPRSPSQQRAAVHLTIPSSWPTSYADVIQTIHKRRRRIPGFAGDVDAMFSPNNNNNYKSGGGGGVDTSHRPEPGSKVTNEVNNKSKKRQDRRHTDHRESVDDSAKTQAQQQIKNLVRDYHNNKNDLFRGIRAAEAMRYYTMTYHEGGTYERQSMALYQELIEQAELLRAEALVLGTPTRRHRSENDDDSTSSVHQEVVLDYPEKSLDGILCGLYTALGKTYFLASLFERAVLAYDACLNKIDGDYFDAVNARGSALIVLGRYEPAGRDLLHVIHQDHHRFFVDAFSGMARVLEAKEEVVDGGWQALIEPTNDLIPLFEYKHNKDENQRVTAAATLARLHHVLFTYHEKKTKDYATAYHHLDQAHQYKLSTLPPWNGANEKLKVLQLQSIFTTGFWGAQKTGSDTKVPIFIIGFVRSGSTLLERILDAHPDIVGTGEDSVFNGRLGDIRNAIVAASNAGEDLADVTEGLADEVIEEMYRRWRISTDEADAAANNNNNTSSSSTNDSVGGGDDATKAKKKRPRPKRLADKMLTNYYNVGFIEMLYPNALILHVAREPMDSIFSAFKHDFPPGTLDYTSDMDGVTDLYHAYRDVMDHWDQVLPGRITHIRYEDMVNDFAGTARAIVNATGLPWDDAVLQFHKQKHAVNTFSSTQVRKGVYKDGLQFWKRYEAELAPLVQKVGDRVKYDLKTTLAGYTPPPPPPPPPPLPEATTDEGPNEVEEPIVPSVGTDEL